MTGTRAPAPTGALTLQHLLDALGPAVVRPLGDLPHPDVAVEDVVIHDPAAPVDVGPADLVLAVGLAPGSAPAAALVQAAGRARAAGVVFRGPAGAVAPGPGGAAGDGPAVLVTDPGLAWTQLLALVRSLLVSSTAADEPEGDLFSLADTVADLVGGSVVLYDVQHQVLAYSTRHGEPEGLDAVRTDTILGRRTPPDWVRRFEQDGVYDHASGTGVVRVEAYARLRTRLRVAVRAGAEVLGEISVAETTAALGADAEQALERAARLVAPQLVRHRLAADLARSSRASSLHALLEGRGPAEVHGHRLSLPPVGAYAVVAVTPQAPAEGDEPPQRGEPADPTTAERRQQRLSRLVAALVETRHRRAVTASVGGSVYALVPGAPSAPERRPLRRLAEHLVTRLATSGIDAVVAVGPTVGTLGEVRASRDGADQVLRALAGTGRSAALAEEVWADVALLDLRDVVRSRPGHAPCPALARLQQHDRERGTAYVRTLRAYLDAFGDVASAAHTLGLHPNSLRHRVRRLCDVAAIDLADPAQRLVLGLELRGLD